MSGFSDIGGSDSVMSPVSVACKYGLGVVRVCGPARHHVRGSMSPRMRNNNCQTSPATPVVSMYTAYGLISCAKALKG